MMHQSKPGVRRLRDRFFDRRLFQENPAQHRETALADALGPQAALSKSTVSRVCQAIRDEFAAWRTRRLDDLELDYLFVDGSHFKMHAGTRAEPVLAAWGITTAGKPVLVGLEPAGNEGNDAWDDFLDGLTPLLADVNSLHPFREATAARSAPSSLSCPGRRVPAAVGRRRPATPTSTPRGRPPTATSVRCGRCWTRSCSPHHAGDRAAGRSAALVRRGRRRVAGRRGRGDRVDARRVHGPDQQHRTGGVVDHEAGRRPEAGWSEPTAVTVRATVFVRLAASGGRPAASSAG